MTEPTLRVMATARTTLVRLFSENEGDTATLNELLDVIEAEAADAGYLAGWDAAMSARDLLEKAKE